MLNSIVHPERPSCQRRQSRNPLEAPEPKLRKEEPVFSEAERVERHDELEAISRQLEQYGEDFVQVPKSVLYDPQLTSGEYRVLTALLAHDYEVEQPDGSRGRKGYVWCGLERLSTYLGVSLSSVHRWIAGIWEKGYIGKLRRGLGQTNVYYFLKPHELAYRGELPYLDIASEAIQLAAMRR